MSTHSNCAVLWVSNAVPDTARICLSLALQVTVGWNINTGLWSEQKLLSREVVSGALYPYNSDYTNAQKSEISTKIDVYSYGRAHRCASCSAGVICRGCRVVTCNTQPSIYQQRLGHPRRAGILYNGHIAALDLLSFHCRCPYLCRTTFLQRCHTEESK
jgi:hypothetical protein